MQGFVNPCPSDLFVQVAEGAKIVCPLCVDHYCKKAKRTNIEKAAMLLFQKQKRIHVKYFKSCYLITYS